MFSRHVIFFIKNDEFQYSFVGVDFIFKIIELHISDYFYILYLNYKLIRELV